MNEFYSLVNGKKVKVKFLDENSVAVDDKKDSLSIIKIDKTGYRVKYGNKAFICKILGIDNGLFKIFLNNSLYQVDCKTKIEFLAEEITSIRNSEKKVNVKVFAPMSGLVLKIIKNNGDLIKKGDPVIILEAMKMENEILAPNDGKIVLCEVKEGDTIEKNTKLFEIN